MRKTCGRVLPGSDPALGDEVVMLGAHLDSWHTGVGATDNADGSTTVVEALRILKAVGAALKRTIRVALWGGEEDTVERLQGKDTREAAVAMAWFAYRAAMADQKIPRAPAAAGRSGQPVQEAALDRARLRPGPRFHHHATGA